MVMSKRLHTCPNKSNVIYHLQFGFRQQYSTSHALTNITENVRKVLDDGNIGCRVFVDFCRFMGFQVNGLDPTCLIAVSMYL